jgi:hypothetical protein
VLTTAYGTFFLYNFEQRVSARAPQSRPPEIHPRQAQGISARKPNITFGTDINIHLHLSYLVKIDKVDDYFLANKANSIYHLSDYQSIDIPIKALDNIRLGTPPENALQILQGTLTQKSH